MTFHLNETLLAARYAENLTLCVRAALELKLVTVLPEEVPISEKVLAGRLKLDPIAARSFFNVLWSLGILDRTEAGLTLGHDVQAYLSPTARRPLSPYLQLGSGSDEALQHFVAFLRAPHTSSRLYAQNDERCVMDEPDGGSSEVAFGLASRAARFTPLLAREIVNHASGEDCTVLDAGAGSPYLAQALLELKPNWEVILADRSNAMSPLARMAADCGFSLERVQVVDWNFFDDRSSTAPRKVNIVCASNVLHDWNPDQICAIADNFVRCLTPSRRSQLIVHEGILPTDRSDAFRTQWMASYGQALNRFTAGQGSCYTAAEYDKLLQPFGFTRTKRPIETVDGCSALIYDLTN